MAVGRLLSLFLKMISRRTIEVCFAILVIGSIRNDYVESANTKSTAVGIEEPFVPSDNEAINEHNGQITSTESERLKKIQEEKRKHKEEDGVPTVDSEANKLDMSARYFGLLRRCVRDGELGTISKKMYQFLNETNLTVEDVRNECTRLRTEKGNGRSKRSYIAVNAGIWDKCIIPYTKESSLADSAATQLDITFAYYEKYTGFRFVPFDNDNANYGLSHNNYLKFINGGGCWSYVGNLRGSGQNISPCTGQSTQVHEIGHALGFNHEQKSPLSMDYTSLYFENIDSQYRSQYYRGGFTDLYGEEQFYDISSTMHYANWGFSVNYGKTVIANDPDLDFMVGWDNDYYLFRDIQPFHNCFAEFASCNELPICEMGGYPSVIDGSCQCRCPEGLDPATGCTTELVEEIPTAWPEGKFTLLKSTLGACPSGFAEGQMGYTNPEWAWRGGSNISPGYLNGYTWYQDVCTQTSSSNSGYEWPAGQYCILRYDGTCPQGFSEGLMEYYGDEPPANSNNGTLPDGTKGSIHQYQFCCRSDGSYAVEINLPIDYPFILYRENYYGCQKINGMQTIGEYYHMKGEDNDETVYSGSLPYYYAWRTGMVNTYYCVYVPKSSAECGGVITLESGTHNIMTPNYPSNYGAGNTCMWHFESPEGTTMKLDFADFEVSSAGGSCDGFVGIKNYYPGMPSRQMCGHNNLRTHWSYRNTLTVSFEGGLNTYKGFNATVEVMADDRCYAGDGKGNYAGDVNETRYYNPCVPWIDAVDCLYSQFDARTIDFDLNNNYCRNIGTGQMPWCYIRAEGCIRENCDACQEGRCHDLEDNCAQRISEDPNYCEKDELGEAKRLCKLSCGECRPTQSGPVYCNTPETIGCTAPTPMKEQYSVGESVRYSCPSGNEYRTSTCTSNGEWTYVNPICNVCPTGWSVVDKQCLLWLGYNVILSHDEAKTACQNRGGVLVMAKTTAINTFIQEVADVYLDDEATVWLGVKRNGSDLVWVDGESISLDFWDYGPFSSTECARASAGRWFSASCSWTAQVICHYPISGPSVCEDNSPNCEELLESIPDMCSSQPDYAWHNCRATCAVDDCSTPIQCTTSGADNLSIVTSSTVSQGEYIEYECDDDHYLTSGNLKRACLPSGLLNGGMPVCSPAKQTSRVEFLTDKELFARETNQAFYVQISPDVESARIPIDGHVSEWIFYSGIAGANVAFQVWRPTNVRNTYIFIGENIIQTTVGNGKMVARIPLEEQIEARAGDLIGIHFNTNGLITYTRCDLDYMPENGAWLATRFPNLGTLTAGNEYDFDDQSHNCRIYSIRLTMNPCGCE